MSAVACFALRKLATRGERTAYADPKDLSAVITVGNLNAIDLTFSQL